MTEQGFNPEDIARTIMSKSFLQKRGTYFFIKIVSEKRALALIFSMPIVSDLAHMSNKFKVAIKLSLSMIKETIRYTQLNLTWKEVGHPQYTLINLGSMQVEEWTRHWLITTQRLLEIWWIFQTLNLHILIVLTLSSEREIKETWNIIWRLIETTWYTKEKI